MSVVSVLVVYDTVVLTLLLVLLLAWVRALRLRAADAGAGRAAASTAVPPAPGGGLVPGMPAPVPAVTSGNGLPVLAGGRDGQYLVAFFSVSCAGCRRSLDRFVPLARDFRGTGRVIAVVCGDAAQGADIVDRVRLVATVIAEDQQGPMVRLYQVAAYPYFVLVRHGTVVFAGPSAADLTRRLADS